MNKLLLAPSVVLWLAGVLTPLVLLLRMSLYSVSSGAGEQRFDTPFYQPGTWSIESYQRVFTEPFFRDLIAFTGGLALPVTILTLAAGYILAYSVYRAPPRRKVVLILLITLPKLTNILVFVFGVKMIFGANGLAPVIAGEVLLLTPYAALTLAAALEAVPYEMVEAARGLGASAARAFWLVTLPASLPGLAAAATLTAAWSFTAFLGPYLLGEPAHYTVAVEVDRQVHQDMNWPLAAALNVVLIAVLAAFALASAAARRRRP
jgi:spermidine/putrescine transport system permease protein